MARAATRATFCRLPFEYVRVFIRGLSSELGSAGGVDAALHTPENIDALASGEVGPQHGVPGNVGKTPMDIDRFLRGIEAKHAQTAAVEPNLAEDCPDRRRLSSAVGAEKAVDVTCLHAQVQPVKRTDTAESLHQIRPFDKNLIVTII